MKPWYYFIPIISFLITALLIFPSISSAYINDELIEAATLGNIMKVKKLIGQGADLNAKSLTARGGVVNTTALIRASFEGHIKIVKLLIEEGADVNAEDGQGQSALMWAAFRNHFAVAKLLIEKGADVNNRKKIGRDDWTVLMQVVSSTPVLVSASPNRRKQKSGKLDEAHKLEFVKLLIRGGADINAKDKSGNTALSLAFIYGKTKMKKILINSGADVNIQISNGKTPLMDAIENKDSEITKLLLDKGADVNFESVNGSTALMVAAGRGYADVAKVLIEKGAAVNVKNGIGDTALSLAKMNGHSEIVKLLRQAGAVEHGKRRFSRQIKKNQLYDQFSISILRKREGRK